MTRLVAVLRIGFALLGAAALAATAAHAGDTGLGLVSFFSFFTVLSNCALVLVFGYGGAAALLDRPTCPDLLRGAVTLYMAVTGLVYAVALSDVDTAMLAWTNTVLHQLLPLVALGDWLLLRTARRLRWSETARWLVFPLLYLVYTLLRGPHAHWYPYPFLDPRTHGYGHVAAASALVTVAFVAIAGLLTWAGNARHPVRSATLLG
ncbi:Pr6Pr family membrane protein [Streptacidiphilus sp. N1-12]|uniref:Pr6Pr family membrane protein n=2 Tax=Streptacidiphilus alkalitolerans TaxID=3342712 RepID=A0ABV6WR46_9ACTN